MNKLRETYIKTCCSTDLQKPQITPQ